MWQSLNILNIVWIVDWFPNFLKCCEVTALSTFLIMSKISNVFFLLELIFQHKDCFYLFNINVDNITERWKRQLKYSSHFTINKMDFRNCGVFFRFFFCLLHNKSLMPCWYSSACQLIKYKIHIIHSFPHFDKREKTINI